VLAGPAGNGDVQLRRAGADRVVVAVRLDARLGKVALVAREISVGRDAGVLPQPFR